MLILSHAEQASLQFALWKRASIALRYSLAFAAFGVSVLLVTLTDAGFWLWWLPIGAGHALLWCKGQTLQPGGATPKGELTWAPTDITWTKQVSDLEAAGERWDTSPWDVSNVPGFFSMLGISTLMIGAALTVSGFRWDGEIVGLVLMLWLPLWFNGIRTTWNPSELRLKGQALEIALETAQRLGGTRLEPVPLLALRQGKRGPYPVDARLMLRPKHARQDNGFIGIQVQVAINNVQGKNLPYLYCVILMQEGHPVPKPKIDSAAVFELGKNEGVQFGVLRQFANNKGGYETGGAAISHLVATAIRATEDLT